jgi:predicted ATP-dependent endonuclease of OLD family
VVNDGTPTLLTQKGDGAQSLAALAIIRHASERGASGKNLVIAIEEPESHLHPNAIHELKHVIDTLSERHQIILTTHNPLFVDRRVIGNNIIVKDNKARPATKIEEVREALGVRASDNLRHAELVLIVEGEDDRIAIGALLRNRFKYLDEALENGTLALDTLGGASNLSYKITQVRACICLCHVFLDYDRSGKEAFTKAKAKGLIEERDVNFARCDGLPESEIEDLYDVAFYEEIIRSKYRVSLQSPKFKSHKKWSDRVRDCFIQNGKEWDDGTKDDVKLAVARAVAVNPANALNRHKEVVFDSLGRSLEERLKEREKAVQEAKATAD